MGRKEKRSKCQEDAISPSKLTPEQVSLVISEGNFSSKRFCFEKDKGPSIKLVFMLEKRKDGLWVVISLENKLKEKKIFIEQFKLEVVTAKKGLHQILCEQRLIWEPKERKLLKEFHWEDLALLVKKSSYLKKFNDWKKDLDTLNFVVHVDFKMVHIYEAADE